MKMIKNNAWLQLCHTNNSNSISINNKTKLSFASLWLNRIYTQVNNCKQD